MTFRDKDNSNSASSVLPVILDQTWYTTDHDQIHSTVCFINKLLLETAMLSHLYAVCGS